MKKLDEKDIQNVMEIGNLLSPETYSVLLNEDTAN